MSGPILGPMKWQGWQQPPPPFFFYSAPIVSAKSRPAQLFGGVGGGGGACGMQEELGENAVLCCDQLATYFADKINPIQVDLDSGLGM